MEKMHTDVGVKGSLTFQGQHLKCINRPVSGKEVQSIVGLNTFTF